LLFVEVSDPAVSSNALTPMATPAINFDGGSAGAGDGAAGASVSSMVDVDASPTVSTAKTMRRAKASCSNV
jgi:hypothetical protein